MNDQQHLAQLEQQIEQAKGAHDLGEALLRLISNADFKKVILEGYLKHEAVRLVHLKADPQMATADRQAKVIRDIDAVGALADYLRLVSHAGVQAEEAIRQAEACIEEIQSGEAE